eukprot:1614661-Pleurochrysis_carterae.AAC.1
MATATARAATRGPCVRYAETLGLMLMLQLALQIQLYKLQTYRSGHRLTFSLKNHSLTCAAKTSPSSYSFHMRSPCATS